MRHPYLELPGVATFEPLSEEPVVVPPPVQGVQGDVVPFEEELSHCETMTAAVTVSAFVEFHAHVRARSGFTPVSAVLPLKVIDAVGVAVLDDAATHAVPLQELPTAQTPYTATEAIAAFVAGLRSSKVFPVDCRIHGATALLLAPAELQST